MPFTPFPQAQLPPAIVEMLFKGLIIIRPNMGGTCSVWIHTAPDDHFLIVEIRGRTPSGADFLIARHVGPVQPPPLTVNFDSGSTGVFAFHPEGANFNRQTARDTRDLRWAIDLEHRDDFHNMSLSIVATALPSINMSEGIFFTADSTDERNLDVKRKRQSDIRSLRQISTVLSANISPPTGRTVVLNRAGVAGWPITLPRRGDVPGTIYRISVRNEPVAIDFDPTHDELERYYDLVRKSDGDEFQPGERFQLDVRPHFGPRTTDEIPCMPILLGG